MFIHIKSTRSFVCITWPLETTNTGFHYISSLFYFFFFFFLQVNICTFPVCSIWHWHLTCLHCAPRLGNRRSRSGATSVESSRHLSAQRSLIKTPTHKIRMQKPHLDVNRHSCGSAQQQQQQQQPRDIYKLASWLEHCFRS